MADNHLLSRVQRENGGNGRKGSPQRFVFHFKLDTEDVHVRRLRRVATRARRAEMRAANNGKFGRFHAAQLEVSAAPLASLPVMAQPL